MDRCSPYTEQHDEYSIGEQVTGWVQELTSLSAHIQELYAQCQHQDLVPPSARRLISFIKARTSQAEGKFGKCREAGEITPDNHAWFQKILDKCSSAYNVARQLIEKAELRGAAEAEEAEEYDSLQQQQEQHQVAAAEDPPPVHQQDFALKVLSLYVDVTAYQHYIALQTKLAKVEEATEDLSSSPELKKLKFDLQMAVNTPINAISAVSGDHLRDKLKRLLALLSGHTVEISGHDVSIKSHPQAKLFCQNLVARMIVKKGEEQVSSRHDSAFPIAMITAALWREVPEMGDLFLAHFYARCPYLVPFYIPKQPGQSDRDYFESRGYKYNGDVVETQSKFLTRMSGMMRLYFAILVSSPPRGDHPHGPEQAGVWINRVLSLEPEPDITSTMIYDFLQVTGHVLCKEFNKELMDLLHWITDHLLPKLQALSSSVGSGPLSRLELLLKDSLENKGHIPEPEGYLESGFWAT